MLFLTSNIEEGLSMLIWVWGKTQVTFSPDKEFKKEKNETNQNNIQYHLTSLIGLIYYSSRREGIRVTLEIRVPFELHTEVIH